MLDGIGWAATAIFATSYLSRHGTRMRLIQATAALVWIAYGALSKALPIIFANAVVAIMATYSAWRDYRARSPAREGEGGRD